MQVNKFNNSGLREQIISVEVNFCRKADSCSATRRSRNSAKPMDHCLAHDSFPLVPVVLQSIPVHTTPFCLSNIHFIISVHLCLFYLVFFILPGFTQRSYINVSSNYLCYRPFPFDLIIVILFYTCKSYEVLPYAIFSTLPSLSSSKYSPQRSVLKRPQFMFIP
jgi:hypothetical protein